MSNGKLHSASIDRVFHIAGVNTLYTIVNTLYTIVNTLYTIVNTLYTIVNTFYTIVNTLYTISQSFCMFLNLEIIKNMPELHRAIFPLFLL
jgi:hypothetical protein